MDWDGAARFVQQVLSGWGLVGIIVVCLGLTCIIWGWPWKRKDK